MKRSALALVLILIAAPSLVDAGAPAETRTGSPGRPVHTYSIVARDEATGQLGVAVQSHWFSLGSIVTWAEAGVGAIATQSFVDPAYGPRGLALMGSGLSAEQALQALIEVDSGRDVRQVAFVDSQGRIGVHTGARCIESAAHHAGQGYSVQANMMLNDQVVPAMAEAYEAAEGSLAERFMQTLEAAEAAGGDIRGRQSAAILIVSGESSGRSWADKVVELRVEDHPEPLHELRRLLQVHSAYEHMNNGDVAVEENDIERAAAEYSAAAALAPDNLEVVYWQAITLATNGQVEEAIPLLQRVFAADQDWIELTRRLIKPGIIPDTTEGHALVERLISECHP
jgi:uncharacterized Ntn-hydrolase superfamily protein